MWIPGHAMIGWALARATGLARRERAIVTWACVLPDLDGLSIVLGTSVYVDVHHVWLHNLTAAVAIAVGAAALGRHRLATGGLALAAVLLHFVSDGFGLLELRPLWPFRRSLWWPNEGRYWVATVGEVVVPFALLAWSAFVWKREKVSVLEVISPRADRWLEARLAEARDAREERRARRRAERAPEGA